MEKKRKRRKEKRKNWLKKTTTRNDSFMSVAFPTALQTCLRDSSQARDHWRNSIMSIEQIRSPLAGKLKRVSDDLAWGRTRANEIPASVETAPGQVRNQRPGCSRTLPLGNLFSEDMQCSFPLSYIIVRVQDANERCRCKRSAWSWIAVVWW